MKTRLSAAHLALSLACLALAAPGRSFGQGPGFDGLSSAPAEARAGSGAVDTTPFAAELFYGLQVRLRSFKVDADMLAGGKLAMRGQPAKDGSVTLALERPVTHPWKFYWVSPAIGAAEVKCASEVTLSEGTWQARAEAEKEAERNALKQHAAWTSQWGGKKQFDQSFTFFVIGAPKARFNSQLSRGGKLTGISNRMTHRWLPGGFFDWLEKRPQEGYGFWAKEDRPPDWQPHCYHAFAAALKLLEQDALKSGSPEQTASLGLNGRFVSAFPDLPQRTRAVLETLVPRTKGEFSGSGSPSGQATVTELTDDWLGVTTAIAPMKVDGGDGVQLKLTRRSRFDRRRGHMAADRCDVEIWKGDNPKLSLQVGYGPGR